MAVEEGLGLTTISNPKLFALFVAKVEEGLGRKTTTQQNAFWSHAEGSGTTTVGQWSHAEGLGTITEGRGAHAEGFKTTAASDYSHSEGRSIILF